MTATDLILYNAQTIRGGAIDLASPITSGQLNNLLPNVNAIEAESGTVKYRKIFAKNTHGTDTALALSLLMTRFSDANDFMTLFLGTDTDKIGDTPQSIGTGNDVLVTFGGTLTTTPVLPHSVSVTAGAVVATDDGNGVLSGAGVTSGSINYATGAISVTFDVAPVNTTDILAEYRDTLDKMYGIAHADDELNRGTKVVTVSVEGGQTLTDIFAPGDTIHFLNAGTGQKIIKATIAPAGVGASTLTIVEDVPVEVVLINSYIANTIYAGDTSAGVAIPIWVRQTVPQYCQAYSNSYFGINAIFASS